MTALLFLLGQFALAFYLSISNPGSAYGAAGSLVIILVWIYYTAQIVFLGAEFTQVYAIRYGADIQPSKNATWVTGEERAKQGLAGEKARARRQGKGRTQPVSGSPRFFGRPNRAPTEEQPTPAGAATTAIPGGAQFGHRGRRGPGAGAGPLAGPVGSAPPSLEFATI